MERGLGQPGFQALLALGRAGRAAVKLSGVFRFSRTGSPYIDADPYAQALIEAFTVDRCVWGSDWPFVRAKARVDYGPLLACLARWFPDPGDRRKVLWDNPARRFGFAAPAPDRRSA
jgi:predicted TIM-barrel fold metal-dependent hydrolase